jgi:hypothetical protein
VNLLRPVAGSATAAERGMALLAVLFALTLLLLLALPFAVSMSVGAEAAARDVDQTTAESATASVRELLLADAAMSHPSVDPTPTWDGLDEFPAAIDLPKAFAALREDGRVLLGGEVVDQQRFVQLDSASPLVFANAIGAVARTAKQLEPDARELELDDASDLPDAGTVWVAGELIRYGQRAGNVLRDLQRGVLAPEFADGKAPIAESALVLDYRCVLAAAWPTMGADPSRRTRRPYRALGEVLEIAKADFGAFTAQDLDAFARVFRVDTMAATAATWGRPERIFQDLRAGEDRTLVVKSALHLGAGSTVRLRNERTGDVEYGLVMSASAPAVATELSFQSFRLELLLRVAQAFPAIDTVVEPLIPAPVNVNTAPPEVLEATLAQLRQEGGARVHDGQGARPTVPPWLRPSEAKSLAEEIVAARAGGESGQAAPVASWRALVERFWKPRLENAPSDVERRKWVVAYRNLQVGRDSIVEMGTAPWCFQSGPWVEYRAAASRTRSVVAAGVVGRHERSGVAAAVPGFRVEHRWDTQDVFEEAFLLDRRAPYWTTLPINLGAVQPLAPGNDPASRHFPHLAAIAFPQSGFGASRFASTDVTGSGIQPTTATAPCTDWPGARAIRAQETFLQANDLRGHDVAKDGPYRSRNTGPSAGGGPRDYGAQQTQQTRGRHDELAFPYSGGDGFMTRFAASFWAQPRSLANTTLFDHSDGDPDRNRLSVQARDGNLVYEIVDEAGIDPNPSASPAGVLRTASECTLPLAELALPADTPVHVAFSAPSGRPADMQLAVDGIVRGKPKYVTYLASPLQVFDPSLGNNQVIGGSSNERYLDVQVESTEGFPPVGVLRIGLELFEYSSINGNAFRCRWVDSVGGRGARQRGREHRPSIPVDANGEPTVDFDDPQFQGVNLDVFPDHPVGSLVELYGYSALLAEDSPMMLGKTVLDGVIGRWAVARASLNNPRPIVVSPPTGNPFQLGAGIDETWTGDLELADPVPTGRNQPPPKAREDICDAFPVNGGYALLLQVVHDFNAGLNPASTTSARTGGYEAIRYQRRDGNKLIGVQRAQALPGTNGDADTNMYDGRARRYITDYEDWPVDPSTPQVLWDDIPGWITWVVPISIAVQNVGVLWNPQDTGYSEWVQLLPQGGPAEDLEWVRYDAIQDNKHLCRANRAAWQGLYFELTREFTLRPPVNVGPLGASPVVASPVPPWPRVAQTAGWIGYVPQLEADTLVGPQIHAARMSLRFRGDPLTGTSSHPQPRCDVMGVHRLQLSWHNFGAFTGRVGRHDRVALVPGQTANASGARRPAVEWHTVTWQARRYNADNLQRNQRLTERLGPWPFQLVGFRDAVRTPMIGPPRGTIVDEPRRFDRVVKFPSGELPAAYCEQPAFGGAVASGGATQGFVDEIEVTTHLAPDLVLDEPFPVSAQEFLLNRALTVTAAGDLWSQTDLSALLPTTGGLVQIDSEIVAYKSHADGRFTIATNGRGLLNTEARGHDRGARVKFLTHRPAAILAAALGPRDAELMVQARGALPERHGTVLLGRELLHYAWVRTRGDTVSLEMPRQYPAGADRTTSGRANGLFRGRFGTTPQGAAAGEAVIQFPFRFWDRWVERSDDPELAYFQLTINEAPVFFRTLRWREETADARVEVVCSVRADGKLPWEDEPLPAAGLWQLRRGTEGGEAHRLAHHASRLEVRFATAYRPGCLDLTTFRAHGWKMTARIEEVRVQYEGQGRVFDEQVTAR